MNFLFRMFFARILFSAVLLCGLGLWAVLTPGGQQFQSQASLVASAQGQAFDNMEAVAEAEAQARQSPSERPSSYDADRAAAEYRERYRRSYTQPESGGVNAPTYHDN